MASPHLHFRVRSGEICASMNLRMWVRRRFEELDIRDWDIMDSRSSSTLARQLENSRLMSINQSFPYPLLPLLIQTARQRHQLDSLLRVATPQCQSKHRPFLSTQHSEPHRQLLTAQPSLCKAANHNLSLTTRWDSPMELFTPRRAQEKTRLATSTPVQ